MDLLRFVSVSITLATLVTMFLVAVVPLAPTEPVLTGFGVLLASGHGSPVAVIAVAALGCSVSDHLLYGFGRISGVRMLDRLRRRPATAAAIDWLSRNSKRWGTPILVAGRWLPAGGTVGAVLAGTLRWRLRRFTPASLIGSTLWSSYVILIGYLGGSIAGQPLAGIALSLAVALLIGTLTSLLLQRSHRRQAAHQHTDAEVDGSDMPVSGSAA